MLHEPQGLRARRREKCARCGKPVSKDMAIALLCDQCQREVRREQEAQRAAEQGRSGD